MTGNDGYRAYMEYGDSNYTYAGIKRRQIVYAYVKAGETVYFGSDITDSQLDINHGNTGAVTGIDIVVVDSLGNSTAYDNIANGKGHIANYAMEQAGPNTAKNGQTAGYTPHSFTATETGVYEFHFHAKTANGMDSNPTPVTTSGNWNGANASVAAWDVTIAVILLIVCIVFCLSQLTASPYKKLWTSLFTRNFYERKSKVP